MNVFEAVKQSVTTRQAAEHYGIHAGRNGMACCPFHHDKTPSMKLDRRYHCFGCGADGDVIDFAAALYGLGKKEAAVQLAHDFGLSYEDWKPPGKAKKPKPRQKSPEEQFQEAKNRCFRMYEFDLGVLNSERAYITNTLTVSDTTDDSTATETSDFKQYEKAITVTDTYHETKTRFAWVGEVQDERLHTGLEKLSDEDLKLLTLYAVSGFNEYEIAKVFRLSQPAIHKRIAKITLFLKKF